MTYLSEHFSAGFMQPGPGAQCAQITVPVLTRPQSSLINALGGMKKPGASQLPAPVCGKRRLVN